VTAGEFTARVAETARACEGAVHPKAVAVAVAEGEMPHAEVRAAEVAEAGAAKMAPAQMRAAEMRAAEMAPANMHAAKMAPTKMHTAASEAPSMEAATPHMEAPAASSMKAPAPSMEAPAPSSPDSGGGGRIDGQTGRSQKQSGRERCSKFAFHDMPPSPVDHHADGRGQAGANGCSGRNDALRFEATAKTRSA
jgi:hypothetical protein